MTNLQAALGLAQLERIEQFIQEKEIGNLYHYLLQNISGIDLMPRSTNYAKNIYWVVGLI